MGGRGGVVGIRHANHSSFYAEKNRAQPNSFSKPPYREEPRAEQLHRTYPYSSVPIRTNHTAPIPLWGGWLCGVRIGTDEYGVCIPHAKVYTIAGIRHADRSGQNRVIRTTKKAGLRTILLFDCFQRNQRSPLSMLSNTPAATAEPITPETFGPMACISR